MKTKKLYLLTFVFFLGIWFTTNAQVAVTDIDGYTPNNSAVLDVHSTTKGLLVPRLTAAQISSISSPTDGLLVYNTDTKQFYFYSSAKAGWGALGAGGSDGVWSSNTNGIYIPNFNTRVGIGTDAPLSKLEVKGDASIGIDDPLFEVKNNNGETVFAVHQEGVRVYISDGNAKGTKGGFAISGLGATSKANDEYMIVASDSTRIYVKEPTAKGTKGGFAISGISQGKQGSESFLQVTPDNYFIGHLAGYSITTGLYNSFMGYTSGYNTTEGNYNVFLGRATGFTNTTGSENIFIGDMTGYSNSTGFANVFIGDASGYSNSTGIYNIFLGRNSGYSNTVGTANIIVGDYAGIYNTEGSSNVIIGDYAGASNTLGSENIFLGASAGWTNTEGEKNVFLGKEAGYFNDLGNNNIFLGTSSGYECVSGSWNIFIGESSGYSNDEGWANVYIGQSAGYMSDSSKWNVALGTLAGYSNIGGQQNTFLGQESGYNSSTGSFNAFVGTVSGYNNTSGSSNVFVGASSGKSNTTGSYNTFLGTWSGYDNAVGNQNVAIGQQAFQSNYNGDYNVSVGAFSGWSNYSGDYNVFLGYAAGYYETGSNRLYIENSTGNSSVALIYGEFDNDYLRINADVDVYGSFYYTSDRRWKKNIKTIENATDLISKIDGVSYEWKTEEFKSKNFKKGTHYGVIAQDIEKVIPDLVATDKEGYKTVNYTELIPILMQAIKEQQKIIDNYESKFAEISKQNETLKKDVSSLRHEFELLKMPKSDDSNAALTGPSN